MKTFKHENGNEIVSLNVEKKQIVRVYSGIQGCACGCRGNYSNGKQSITKVWNTIQQFEKATHVFTEIDKETKEKLVVLWFDNYENKRCYMITVKGE